jgi:hypothetical protein
LVFQLAIAAIHHSIVVQAFVLHALNPRLGLGGALVSWSRSGDLRQSGTIIERAASFALKVFKEVKFASGAKQARAR